MSLFNVCMGELPVEAVQLSVVLFLACTVLLALFQCARPAPDAAHRAVLLTGAGGGIGRATALHLARVGHPLELWDIDAGAVEATAVLCRAAAGGNGHGGGADRVRARAVDVADGEAVAAAARECGCTPDVLVSCAGVVAGRDVAALSAADVERTLGVNLVAQFHLLRAVLPGMTARGSGCVVLVASVMGMTGAAQLGDYCASKWGMLGLAECVRLELQRDGAAQPWWASVLGRRWRGRGVAVAVVCPNAVGGDGMFKGVMGRANLLAHMPFLFVFPALSTADVAAAIAAASDAAVDAVITLPWHAAPFLAAVRAALPLRVGDALTGAMGGYRGMEGVVRGEGGRARKASGQRGRRRSSAAPITRPSPRTG